MEDKSLMNVLSTKNESIYQGQSQYFSLWSLPQSYTITQSYLWLKPVLAVRQQFVCFHEPSDLVTHYFFQYFRCCSQAAHGSVIFLVPLIAFLQQWCHHCQFPFCGEDSTLNGRVYEPCEWDYQDLIKREGLLWSPEPRLGTTALK